MSREYTPQEYLLNTDIANAKQDAGVFLRTIGPASFDFSFQLIRPNLFRTTFTSKEHPLPPHPSAPLPNLDFGDVKPHVTSTTDSKQIEHTGVIAKVDWSGTPVVSLKFSHTDKYLHEDLPFRSYVVDNHGVSHYSRYKRDTLHVGLGEKAAPMDLSNRSFVISATDCFGYDVYRTDPMYKHIPFLINVTPEGCVGIFSTSHSRGFYSVGGEMDGLWGHFKVYRQAWGGLEEYLIVGHTIADVVGTYASLVGYPLRVPRWAFGYISGGMKYSMLDEPRASDALIEFAEKMKQYDIPCSAYQMSSGYTVAETEPKTRNVFTWNRHRFPDPKKFVDEYRARGIRLIANIKPYVLANHPEYNKLVETGGLFRDPVANKSATARLWSAGGGESGIGGHIDFTSEAGFRWWYNGVKELRRIGIVCMWNDNNEYAIAYDDWICALENRSEEEKKTAGGRRELALWGRALNTELMGKSSHDALLEVKPNERPFVLTRSATAGTMRYAASSWSGDNVTSWEGMKGSNALSLGAGMCLLQCYGHDIGGFEGPQPSPELLVRWVQQGIYSSRFAINCYKTSPEDNTVGDVIEPWMYPETTDLVRAAIKRRYEMIPWIYSLHLESHMTATPPQRWTGWGYESDPEVWTKPLRSGETQFWLGDALLVGGVFEPGESSAKLYLPKKAGDDEAEFLNLNQPHQIIKAGQWVNIESKWDVSIPVLARVGSAIPIGKNIQTLSPGEEENPARLPLDDYRAVEIFPSRGAKGAKWYQTTWFEDDGVSITGSIAKFIIRYSSTVEHVEVEFEAHLGADFKPVWRNLGIVLPVGDDRRVVRKDGKLVKELGKDDHGRQRYEIETEL